MNESQPQSADELADLFLAYLQHEKSLSVNTLEAYSRDLGQWLNFLENEKIGWQQIEQKHIYSFLSQLQNEHNLARSSQARKVASLKSFYRFCELRGYADHSPLKNLRSVRYRRGLPRPLRPVELEIFLEDNSGQKEHMQLRDMALWELMYSSGMRISEILALDLNHVFDLGHSDDTLVYDAIKITGKGSRQRVVFIGQKAAKALIAYRRIRQQFSPAESERALFLNKNGSRLTRRGALHILKTRQKNLGLAGEFSPHSLRHSFATDLLNAGADIRHVQEMLGHASVSTTQNYTAVAKERLQNVFRQAHPHARKS